MIKDSGNSATLLCNKNDGQPVLQKTKFINNIYCENVFSAQKINDHHVDRVIKKLTGNHKYKALFLAHNQLTDTGFARLAQHLETDDIVEHLILSHNQLTFENCSQKSLNKFMKNNSTNRFLVLANNQINDIGVTKLAKALTFNQSIKHIILSNNQISDIGFKEFLTQLRIQKRCETLVLMNNQLTNKSLPLLIDFIKNDDRLKRINIQGNMFSDQELVQKLMKQCKSKAIQLKID